MQVIINNQKMFTFAKPKILFFSHKLDEAGEFYYGEDQSFCHRWVVGCGGDIWVDSRAKIGHVGAFTFWGDPQQVQSPPFAPPPPQE